MPKEKFICGIDPGSSGAVCILTESGNIVHLEKMPTIKIPVKGRRQKFRSIIDMVEFSKIISTYEPDIVLIEDVHAMPGQGVSSSFSFGFNHGCIVGLCMALEAAFHTQMVSPQRWQKNLTKGEPGDPKQRAKIVADRLYPGANTKHDGCCDALLIAEYGRRSLKLN